MSRLSPLTADHLDGAARLLARRHEEHREHLPLLAAIDAREAVEHAWIAASGSCVVSDGEGGVQGYLLWHERENPLWGRFVWVDRLDHAATGPEVLRDLYAAVAQRWADAGLSRHAAVVPATPGQLDPWERLAFARMQVHALRPLTSADDRPLDPRIRPSGVDEIDAVVQPFASTIWEHQARSPVLTGHRTPDWHELRPDWVEALQEAGAIHLVLEEDNLPRGHALLYPSDPQPGYPSSTARLAVVSVDAAHRGRGIGGALAHAGFAEARRAGFTHVETDWRITNLEASRSWTAMGFVPAFHRLWRVTGTG